MSGFRKRGREIRGEFSEYEVTLLESLTEQLVGLLEVDPGAEAADDPFARWEAELSGTAAMDSSDPVIQRLFPDAYRDDQGAADDFRRFTEGDQRRAKMADAETVLNALEASEGGRLGVIVTPGDQAEAWLRTLSAIRLSLAVRLGIAVADDAEGLADLPPDDPRGFVYNIYEWVGYLLEALLASL